MKEEDEWDSPHIVRYLEVLSDEEIEKIKELAKPRVSPCWVSWQVVAVTIISQTEHKNVDINTETVGIVLAMISVHKNVILQKNI